MIKLTRSFVISSFVRSFVRLFVRSFVRSFIGLLRHYFITLLLCLFIIRSFINSFIIRGCDEFG